MVPWILALFVFCVYMDRDGVEAFGEISTEISIGYLVLPIAQNQNLKKNSEITTLAGSISC